MPTHPTLSNTATIKDVLGAKDESSRIEVHFQNGCTTFDYDDTAEWRDQLENARDMVKKLQRDGLCLHVDDEVARLEEMAKDARIIGTNPFFKVRIENCDFWSVDDKDDLLFPSLKSAIADATSFINDAQEQGLDYTLDDIEIDEFDTIKLKTSVLRKEDFMSDQESEKSAADTHRG